VQEKQVPDFTGTRITRTETPEANYGSGVSLF
jgi:hypothetical protein